MLSDFTYAYDEAARMASWFQANSGNTAGQTYGLGYDEADQLASAVLYQGQTNTILHKYGYGYDLAGNRLQTSADGVIEPAIFSSISQPANELLQAGGAGAMTFFGTLSQPSTVTINGSAAAMSAGGTTFSGTANVAAGANTVTIAATQTHPVPNTSPLTKTNNYTVNIAADARRAFAYDANGSTLSDGVNTYEWDAANRMTAINYTGGARTEFTYDGIGRRTEIKEKANGGAVTSDIHFLWEGLTLVQQMDTTGTVVTKRYFGNGFQDAVAAQNYFYTRDQLGSVREVTNQAGTVLTRYDYDLWGTRTATLHGAVDSDFGFTGHYYHNTSALCLAPFRAYSAFAGRWLSRDPIAEGGGSNLFAYVGRSPADRVDPLGLYGYATKFWADLSVNGNFAQRAISWPMMFLAAMLPDSGGLSGTFSAGFVSGGTVGVNRQWFYQDEACSHQDFGITGTTFDNGDEWNRAPAFMSPQIGFSFQANLAWSSQYNPGASSWEGDFKETNLSLEPVTATGFGGNFTEQGQTNWWKGIGLGLTAGPVPESVSNMNVKYSPVH